MIQCNCETSAKIKLQDLVPFQGKLKKRTDEDLTNLARSIVNEGLHAPFFVWKHEDKNYVLDGHGRLEALMRVSMLQPEILDEEFPCVYIEADTEEAARKALLQITSSYGKITKAGLKKFTATISDYVAAPVITNFRVNMRSPKINTPESDTIIMRIKVKKDAKEQVVELLKTCSLIEVL